LILTAETSFAGPVKTFSARQWHGTYFQRVGLYVLYVEALDDEIIQSEFWPIGSQRTDESERQGRMVSFPNASTAVPAKTWDVDKDCKLSMKRLDKNSIQVFEDCGTTRLTGIYSKVW
jgi:hypothetical protein